MNLHFYHCDLLTAKIIGYNYRYFWSWSVCLYLPIRVLDMVTTNPVSYCDLLCYITIIVQCYNMPWVKWRCCTNVIIRFTHMYLIKFTFWDMAHKQYEHKNDEKNVDNHFLGKNISGLFLHSNKF